MAETVPATMQGNHQRHICRRRRGFEHEHVQIAWIGAEIGDCTEAGIIVRTVAGWSGNNHQQEQQQEEKLFYVQWNAQK